jgi:hypothetical protein
MVNIDKNIKNKKLTITLESAKWTCLLTIRSGTAKMLINKNIVKGLALERGTQIHNYIGEDEEGQTVMISYFGNKPRSIEDETSEDAQSPKQSKGDNNGR